MADSQNRSTPFYILLVLLIVGAVVGFFLRNVDLAPGNLTLDQAFTSLTALLIFLYVVVFLLLLMLALVLRRLGEVKEEQAATMAAQEDLRRQVLALTDDSNVESIEGIGPGYGKRLKGKGITHMRHLLVADARLLADELAISHETVLGWQQMAELIQIRGIGPQYAELLVRAGIKSIEQLAHESPATLAAKADGANVIDGVRIQKNEITNSLASKWIEAAKNH